ncbi:hypothetical protein, partial [Acetobacter tropicalis]|uniref:hypothetical protein n=1 Tax=Acetobacter tropicalis TaxID=104102 RepID=UPI001305447A
ITSDGSGNLTTTGYNKASYYASSAASWSSSSNKVYGQGSIWGWNMLSGDAYTYLWNILPSSGYNSGFKFCIGVNGTTVDGTSIVSFDKTGNIHSSGGIYTTKSSSFDNGSIISNGSGTLTFMNDKNITMWPATVNVPGIILKSSGSSTFKITDTTGADGILSCGNIISSGTTSLDSGKITSDGS